MGSSANREAVLTCSSDWPILGFSGAGQSEQGHPLFLSRNWSIGLSLAGRPIFLLLIGPSWFLRTGQYAKIGSDNWSIGLSLAGPTRVASPSQPGRAGSTDGRGQGTARHKPEVIPGLSIS